MLGEYASANEACKRRYLVAGYGLPAEFGVMALFGMGAIPDQVKILTHPTDNRNAGLHSLAQLRGVDIRDSDVKAQETTEWVRSFAPDVLLSLHFRSLIPAEILDLAALGSVNLHPSLLPDYRGTNSVAWAIIKGEKETGFTFHRMDEKFDTGRILLQEKIEIAADDTAFSLFHRQIVRSMRRLEDVIGMLIDRVPGTQQKPGGSYFNRTVPHDATIDGNWDLDKVERFIRAMYFPPFDPAAAVFNGTKYLCNSLADYLAIKEKHA